MMRMFNSQRKLQLEHVEATLKILDLELKGIPLASLTDFLEASNNVMPGVSRERYAAMCKSVDAGNTIPSDTKSW